MSGPEWLYEDGIGEARAALVCDGVILEAMIEADGGGPRAGAVVEGRLTSIAIPARRGFVTIEGGRDILVEPLLRHWTQGSTVRVAITREAIPERGRSKRAKARPAAESELTDGPDLRARIVATNLPVRTVALREPDAFEAAGWSELIECAHDGVWRFPGGELRIAPTPAMTLIDVDGHLDPATLALAAATAAGRAIRALGIAGSIGIDFPTLGGKEIRTAVAAAFDAALSPPFERTAVNGFGFLQIIRPRARASLLEHAMFDATAHAARAVLRRVEREGRCGSATIVVNPRIAAVLAEHPDWLARLGRQLGGTVGLRSAAGMAMSGGYAEPA